VYLNNKKSTNELPTIGNMFHKSTTLNQRKFVKMTLRATTLAATRVKGLAIQNRATKGAGTGGVLRIGRLTSQATTLGSSVSESENLRFEIYVVISVRSIGGFHYRFVGKGQSNFFGGYM
jgi:hypothetical protein